MAEDVKFYGQDDVQRRLNELENVKIKTIDVSIDLSQYENEASKMAYGTWYYAQKPISDYVTESFKKILSAQIVYWTAWTDMTIIQMDTNGTTLSILRPTKTSGGRMTVRFVYY